MTVSTANTTPRDPAKPKFRFPVSCSTNLNESFVHFEFVPKNLCPCFWQNFWGQYLHNYIRKRISILRFDRTLFLICTCKIDLFFGLSNRKSEPGESASIDSKPYLFVYMHIYIRMNVYVYICMYIYTSLYVYINM